MLGGFEAQVKLIVDNAIVGVYLFQDDKFWYVNPVLAKIFGYEPEEVIERLGPLDVIHPDDRDLVRRQIQIRLEGKEEHLHYVFRGLRKDGTVIYCETFGSRVHYRGKPAIVGTIIDITERKRAEESLRRSEEQYRTLVEAARDVIFSLSTEGVITSLNPAFELSTGWPRSQWIGEHFSVLVHPEDLPLAEDLFQRVLNGESSSPVDLRIRQKSDYGIYELTGAPIVHEGRVTGALGIARDVTSRREMEEKLQWELAVNSVVSEIAHTLLSTSSLRDVGYELLDRVTPLTGSKHGFLSIVDPETSREVRLLFAGVHDEECTAFMDEELTFSRGADGRYHGLWGHALNTGQPFFTNAPDAHEASAGVPAWHVPIKNFAAAPAVAGGKVLGQIALANSPRGYTQRDLEALKRIANLYALAVLRHWEAKALKESEESYRSLIDDVVESSNVGLFILDADFKVVWINRAIERFFGLKREEVVGRDKRQLVRERIKYMFEDPDGFAAKVLATYDNNTYIENFECHVLPGPGREERWLEHWSQPIESGLYAGGRIEHYYDITGRKRAEEALRESEERYYDLIENIGDLVMSVTPDGRILYVNRAWRETLGYSREENSRLSLLDITHPNSRTHFMESFRRALSGERIGAIEAELVTKSGGRVAVRGNMSCKFINDEPAYARVVLSDVTEQEQAKRELEYYARQQQALAELGHMALTDIELQALFEMAVDRVARTLEVEYCEILRLLPQENALLLVAGVGWKEGLVGSVKVGSGRDSQAGYTLLSSEPVVVRDLNAEKRFRGPQLLLDHKIVSGVSVIIGEPQNPLGVLGAHTATYREFSENEAVFLQTVANILAKAMKQKKAEEGLRESEGKYRTLTESSLSGIFINRGGKYVFVNNRFAQIYGYTPEELIGKDCIELVHPDDRETARQRLSEALSRGFEPQEVRGITKDGRTIWCEVVATRIRYEGEPAIMGNVFDITERKSLERQLIQAQKMEAIGRLTAGIAHDFNNMISAIRGFTELSMMHLGKKDPIYANLKHIWDASNRAADLVRKLLYFSRSQPLEMRPLDLNVLLKDLCRVVRRLIGEDITVSLELDTTPCVIQGDAGSIEQVIMNLAVNARDAMPQGGELTIKTENVRIDENYTDTYPYARPGEFVCLSVADTGIGMDDEVLRRIFDPFFTTKKSEEGTGLGLSVVYGIVKGHGGWISVESEPGVGSTFRIYLPAALPPTGETVSRTRDKVPLLDFDGRGWRVLVVEDDDGLREFAKRALSGHGYVVFESANAKEAMAIFEREGGNFHLVFTDVVLPDKSGLQLVEDLLSSKPELCVLLSSGYTDHRSQWPVIREKGFEFLQKPFTMVDLLRAVKKLLEASGAE